MQVLGAVPVVVLDGDGVPARAVVRGVGHHAAARRLERFELRRRRLAAGHDVREGLTGIGDAGYRFERCTHLRNLGRRRICRKRLRHSRTRISCSRCQPVP